MKLDNEFTVSIPIDRAWAVLTDLELIAPCMPGAQLTGVVDGVYTGKVKIKVGPVTAEYAGTAQFAEKDEASHRAVIDARGRDSRGQGNATAVISAQLRSASAGTVVTVGTDLTIAGRIAQFGSGMIKEVSARLLGQFVACLEQRLTDLALPSEVTAEAANGAGGQPAPAAPSPAAGQAPDSGQPAASGQPPSSAQPVVSGQPAASGQPPSSAQPVVSGLSAGSAQAPTGAGEPAALDLLGVAGGAIYKRAIPIAVAVLVVIAVVIWLIVR